MKKNQETMNTKRLLIAAAVTASVVAVLAWAFAPRPQAVELATVQRGLFERTIDEDGKTRVRDRYVVAAPLAGRLERITLREGDRVEAQQVVARLAPTLAPMLDARTLAELRERVGAAEAQVRAAGARAQLAQVRQQQAEDEWQRNQALAQQGFISESRLTSARLAREAALREQAAAAQELETTRHLLAQARAAVRATQPGDSAPGRLFEVRSPIGAQVLRVPQTSEGVVSLGTPLMELGDTADLEIVAELLTSEAVQVQPGMPARIERWGGPQVLEARVKRVEPGAFTKVSALGVEEQRVEVLLELASSPAERAALGDGYRVGVRLVAQSVPDALLVPVSAVFPHPEQPGRMAAFTLRDGRALLRTVEVGGRNGVQAWVRQGLDEAEQVIVYPPPNVHDGVRVQPRKRNQR